MDYSILICTKNSSETIEKCLLSILHSINKMSPLPDFEFVIVDGASTDDTIAKVEAILDGQNKQTFVRGDLGLSLSRYFGFEAAISNTIVQIDSDVYVHENYFEDMANDWVSRDEQVGAIEYGVRDWHYLDVPNSNSTRDMEAHAKRAYFFVTVLDKNKLNFKSVELRHLEEEYVRRILKENDVSWEKKSKIVGDHHSKPARYDGSNLSSIERTKKFPKWTYEDEGYLNKITSSHHSFVYHLSSVIYRSLNISLFVVWFKSISNPVANVLSYIKGYYRD